MLDLLCVKGAMRAVLERARRGGVVGGMLDRGNGGGRRGSRG